MWVRVAKLADLAPDRACVVRAGGQDLALVCTSEGLYAMDNACPHSGGALGEGLVEGDTVTCALHGWKFECKTGRSLTEKRPNQRLYSVKIEKDDVLVEVPEPEAQPVAEGKPAREWTVVAEAASLQPGTVRKVEAGGVTMALLCTAEGAFALENACAHEAGPLCEGSVDGTTVTCPLHGWKFEGKTGQCHTEARYKQRTFETKIEQGKVWVRVPALAPAAAPVDPAKKKSPAEAWKQAKHGIDVWPDVLRWAQEKTSMSKIEEADLERLKWYGYFYRKNNDFEHYMARVRIPGCEMTAAQARAVAYTAYESGYSLVDVTTRGNLQVQGLTIDKLPSVRAALEKVGLNARQTGHDNIRNITSHPWSGIDPDELIDTRDLARQIQAMIIGNREFSDLPRKMNVALTGRPDPAAHAWTQDICYAGTVGPDNSVGFHLLLGGNQGQSPKLSWHIPVFVRPEQVLGVTAAVIRAFRELGYRHNRHQVRMRYLIDRIGPDGMLLEIERRLGYELERFPKLVEKPNEEESFVGWFPQKQEGRWAVGVCVPLGRLTADEMDGLAVIAQRYGDGGLRTTYDQNLILTGIPESARQEVGFEIARYGLTFEPDPVSRNMVACTGKQFCNIAVTETKGYAYRLIEELRRRRVQLHGIRVAMSGCPSSCAMSYTADIGMKGVKIRRGLKVLDAFDLYVGGGLGQEVQMGTVFQKNVPFDQLPDVVEKLVREFHLQRSAGQTFSGYWQEKLKGHKAEALKVDMPRWMCSKCRHVHVAQDPPPFCPICAAIRSKFEPAPDEVESPEPAKTPGAPATAPVLAAVAEEGALTAAALWLCRSCGLKHEGPEPPDICSVCGVKKSDFQRAPLAAGPVSSPRAKARPAGKRLVIVGGSVGGHTAAQTARALDPGVQITLVTDEKHSFYNRLNLTRFLADEVKRDELFDYTPSWYEEHQVEVLTGSRVIGLDPLNKTVLLEEGRELSYDACILTHGSAAVRAPFYRTDLDNVYPLRTLGDVESIIGEVKPGAKVAVIGGGVLGLEAAYGAKKRGATIQIFEYLPWLMPRQLDCAAAAMFQKAVEAKGLETYCGVGVKELVGKKKRATGVTLLDERTFEADLVIASTGIRPNIDWVKRSGIQCDRGILADDRMQTSAPDVYAAGDVVEWRSQVVGLWTNAIEQAKVAAANAVGKMAFFQGFLPVTILKVVGIPLVSIGEIQEDGGAITSRTTVDEAAGTYRRVIFRNGIPVGSILLGTSAGMGELRKLIEGGLELERLKQKVVPEETLVVAQP
jgi:ferredoxin-nitrite reductase